MTIKENPSPKRKRRQMVQLPSVRESLQQRNGVEWRHEAGGRFCNIYQMEEVIRADYPDISYEKWSHGQRRLLDEVEKEAGRPPVYSDSIGKWVHERIAIAFSQEHPEINRQITDRMHGSSDLTAQLASIFNDPRALALTIEAMQQLLDTRRQLTIISAERDAITVERDTATAERDQIQRSIDAGNSLGLRETCVKFGVQLSKLVGSKERPGYMHTVLKWGYYTTDSDKPGYRFVPYAPGSNVGEPGMLTIGPETIRNGNVERVVQVTRVTPKGQQRLFEIFEANPDLKHRLSQSK